MPSLERTTRLSESTPVSAKSEELRESLVNADDFELWPRKAETHGAARRVAAAIFMVLGDGFAWVVVVVRRETFEDVLCRSGSLQGLKSQIGDGSCEEGL